MSSHPPPQVRPGQVKLQPWIMRGYKQRGFYCAYVDGHLYAKIGRTGHGCHGNSFQILNALGVKLLWEHDTPENQHPELKARYMRLQREEGRTTTEVLRARVATLINLNQLRPEHELQDVKHRIEQASAVLEAERKKKRALKYARLQQSIEAIQRIMGGDPALRDAEMILVRLQGSPHLGVDIDDVLTD